MTNEELKKKIIDVLRGNREHELRYHPDDNYTEVVFDYEAIADALIAEGIVEVPKDAVVLLSEFEQVWLIERKAAEARLKELKEKKDDRKRKNN